MSTSTARPDQDRLLRVGLARLRKVTGVDGTMGGLVSQGGGNLVITEHHNMLVNAFQGTLVTPGAGLGGRALQLARPVAVNDYLRATAISHQYDRQVQQERIHGAFAVPVRLGSRSMAVVYGMMRTRQNLGDRVLVAAGSVAAQLAHELAVEIEVARRLDDVDEERRRLARSGLGSVDALEICEELLSIAEATSDPSVRDRLVLVCDRLSPPDGSSRNGAFPLTRRECEVLGQIAIGLTNNEVAERLSLMPTTVKSYLKNAMRKFGTRNRVETILAARHAGIVR
jgi:LuxR family transcriptional regulator, regulator of acetate metabolism